MSTQPLTGRAAAPRGCGRARPAHILILVVDERSTGMKRAEIEGQVSRLSADPSLLGALSRAHDALRPDEPPYAEVRVVEQAFLLRGSQPTGEAVERVVARWVRP